MGVEPDIDAVDVEHVRAPGEQPEGVFVGELGKAHSALQRIVPFFVLLRLGIRHGRERSEHLRVDSPPHGATGDRAGLHNPGGSSPAGTAGAALPQVDGEESKEEEATDEGDDEGGDSGVDLDVVAAVGAVAEGRLRGLSVDTAGSDENQSEH